MTKNHDFDIKGVIRQLVKVFKTKRNEATVGDLITETGLPKFQVGQAIKVMMDEYYGGMKVTDTGEIIYYFPNGMVNRVNGFSARLKRAFDSALKAIGVALTFLFKAWIVVMLAGYFIAFVVLTILLIVAAIAGSSASKNKGKSWTGSHSGRSLVRSVIELVIHLLLYSSLSSNRDQTKLPFHKAVFYYVFGEQNPGESYEDREKKILIRYIQEHKGTLTIDEISLVTGKDFDEANKTMNKFLVEYEGEPEVTEEGTLFVKFPVLMQTTEDSDAADPALRKLISNDAISATTKLVILIMNCVNLVFGLFITLFSFVITGTPETNPITKAINLLSEIGIRLDLSGNLIGIVLGLIPLTYSILFFAIRQARLHHENIQNNEIKQQNFFKRIIASIFMSPEKVDPEQILPSDHREEPSDWQLFRKNSMDRYGEVKGIDFEATDDGKLIYKYRELKRELDDLTRFRKGFDVSQYSIGETVYDSGS